MEAQTWRSACYKKRKLAGDEGGQEGFDEIDNGTNKVEGPGIVLW